MHLSKGKIPLILCDALSASFLPVLDLRGQESLIKALLGLDLQCPVNTEKHITILNSLKLFYVQGECMTVTEEIGQRQKNRLGWVQAHTGVFSQSSFFQLISTVTRCKMPNNTAFKFNNTKEKWNLNLCSNLCSLYPWNSPFFVGDCDYLCIEFLQRIRSVAVERFSWLIIADHFHLDVFSFT